MAAFTLDTGGTVNWDTLTGGSTNATLDTYKISNRTTLLIDTDTYQCTNHSAAFGSVDTVSFSGTGGRLLVDGRNVRVIAYTGGTGNVPAVGSTITQGGVSATFLGVWANWLSEPTASGAAMPATGFIKVKNKTGGNFTAGALTGIGATASGADVVGWIEVRGADTATITVPRIGKFEVVGDWFELGTTNGTRGQTLACPTTATVAGVFPAVWVETAPGSGVFERYNSVGSLAASASIPTDVRGKVFWQTTSGIRFGSDGTNNVGFLPPAGCRVRIPNVIFTCCTRTAGSGSGPRVLPNSTLATRQEFVTTAAGDIQLSNCVMQWYCNFVQAYRADVVDSAINDTLVLQEIASPLNVNNVVVAPTQSQINFALDNASCFAGGTVQNCTFARISLAAFGNYVNTVRFVTGVTYSNVRSLSLTLRAHGTTGVWAITQPMGCNFTNCENIGGRMLMVAPQNCTITNLRYADTWAGTTGTAYPMYAVDISTGGNGVTIDGIDFFGLTNVHPYSGLLQSSSSYNITLRNVGTASAPISLGSANQTGLIFNSGGNNNGIKIQRVYTSATRIGTWAFGNTDVNVQIDNTNGDYADTSVMAAMNAQIRACGLTSTTRGQTSVYGTHFAFYFTSATVGKLVIMCNEASAATQSQCYVTSGTPLFNSLGQVALTAVGDEVTWDMPFFMLGITSMANLAPTFTGTNTDNLEYEFQWDTGTGFNGSWLTLNGANLSGVGAIDPATGVRLRVRARCIVANTSNLLTNISIPLVTNATAQQTQYPIATATVELTGLQAGSEVRAYVGTDPATATELAGIESSGTTFSFSQSVAGQSGFIVIASLGYEIIRLPITYSATNVSIPIQQRVDRNYLNS